MVHIVSLAKIYKNINCVIEKTGYKVYGNEVEEGFDRPSFFVQLMPIYSNTFKKDISENSIMVEIVYFNNKNSLETFLIYDLLKKSFGSNLIVENRKLLIRNFRGESIESNIYSIKFDLNFYDEITDDIEENELVESLNINIKGGI